MSNRYWNGDVWVETPLSEETKQQEIEATYQAVDSAWKELLNLEVEKLTTEEMAEWVNKKLLEIHHHASILHQDKKNVG